MEYINMIWKISTLLYTVLVLVKGQLMQDFMPFDYGDTQAILNTTKQTIIVHEGETAVFPCVGTNMEVNSVAWLYGPELHILGRNRTLQNDDDRYTVEPLSNTGEKLKIKNITLNDPNKFTCMVNSIPPQMKDFDLIVKAPAKIDKTNMKQMYQYVQGESIEIICQVWGSPEPDVKWYFYKTKTEQTDETRAIVSTNNHLNLKNLSMGNEGIYRCEAENDIASDMYEIFLQETYEPKVVTPMVRTHAKLGGTVTLQCEVESFPAPEIFWQRNEELIDKEDWKYMIQVYAESETKQISILTIGSADKTDSGLYFCIARNNLGRDHIKLYLIVEDNTVKTTTMRTTPENLVKLTTTMEYLESSDEKVQVKASTTPESIVRGEEPRTEASMNKGTKPMGNLCLFGLLLSVLLKHFVS